MILGRYKIEPRLEPKLSWQILSIVLVVFMSGIVCAIMLKSADVDVGKAFGLLYSGAFGSWKATVKTLVKASPLILTGLAVTVAFRAKIWNIGAEGQLFAGAITSFWGYSLCLGAPSPIMLSVVFLSGFAGGALYGGLAGYLKARFELNEVLSTVMLNYVIRYVLSFLLISTSWRDPSSFYQQTVRVVKEAKYPLLFGVSRLHIGFGVALLLAVVVYIFLKRTSLGYEIRAIGFNPKASRFKGINTSRTIIVVMMISGGLAGLAGAGEVFGVHYRLKPDISVGFGFVGIIIAMISALNPLTVVLSAILFGGLVNGGIKLQVFTGIPTAMISTLQAIILLFFLTAAVLTRYEIKRGRAND
jgi:ABC-type uncharacterized transport system permease subunit